MSRFEHLRGQLPDEILEALDREVEHPDPLESNEDYRRSILDEAVLEASVATDGVVSQIESITQEAYDGAIAALEAESAVINSKITAGFEESREEITALVDTSNAQLGSDIADVADQAAASLAAEVTVLNGKVDSGLEETRVESSALVGAAIASLESDIHDVADQAAASLVVEAKAINDRIGTKHTVSTTNAAPTVAATITPSARSAYRIGAKIIAMRDDHYESAAYSINTIAKAVPSNELLTFVGNASNGDQVEIDGVTYTFEAVLTLGGTNNVLLGGATAATITNLINAINDTGTPDVDYGAGTSKHPTFAAFQGAGTTMLAIARLPGVAADGSSVTDPTDVGVVMSWGAAVTSGGSDMTLFNGGAPVTTEYEDDAAWAVGVAANGADVEISVTGVVGKNITWVIETEYTEVQTAV